MLNNIELFNECLDNPAKNVDIVAREILNKVILPIDTTTKTELLKRNTGLLELLSLYNDYKAVGDKSHNAEIIAKMDQCLRYEGMNYCPFSQYFMVHDVTHTMYLHELSQEEKEYIIDCYLEDRHQLYLNRGYSDIVFQVLMDSYSHKRKGSMGVEKLKKLCETYHIDKIDNDSQIKNRLYYILPDAGDNKLFNKIVECYHINFDFRKTHQGKMPDILIKYGDNFLIGEHKILKQSGGGQDKQITEIIDFIGNGERGVHYVSFMDGILFNELIDPSPKNKLFRDRENIISNLKKNPYNYFVNAYGFNQLIDYITKGEQD